MATARDAFRRDPCRARSHSSHGRGDRRIRPSGGLGPRRRTRSPRAHRPTAGAASDSGAPDAGAAGISTDGIALLCVPLVASAQTLGLIYLDSRNPATRFTNDDLQLLTAIAGLASIAIVNARQFERLGN